jgi:hypothetical protein
MGKRGVGNSTSNDPDLSIHNISSDRHLIEPADDFISRRRHRNPQEQGDGECHSDSSDEDNFENR